MARPDEPGRVPDAVEFGREVPRAQLGRASAVGDYGARPGEHADRSPTSRVFSAGASSSGRLRSIRTEAGVALLFVSHDLDQVTQLRRLATTP
ncbi:MAG: hypothetical protein GEV04_14260 [Actinophytocola sp.]|nr:hypothetical protein [Actinophytocola sp.]